MNSIAEKNEVFLNATDFCKIIYYKKYLKDISQLAFPCSKSTIETLENYVWNMFRVNNKNTRTTNDVIDVFLVFLLLTLNLFHTFV